MGVWDLQVLMEVSVVLSVGVTTQGLTSELKAPNCRVSGKLLFLRKVDGRTFDKPMPFLRPQTQCPERAVPAASEELHTLKWAQLTALSCA